MPRNHLIQVRRDTAANWTTANPTLAAGEIGFETDTGNLKCGDGSTAWSGLSYVKPFTSTTASRLLGRGSSGAGAAQEITLGSGLSMSGTTLSVSAGGGNVSTSGSPVTGDYARWASASTIESRTASQARGDLGLGSIATQAANAVTITGGGISDTEIRLDLAAPGSPVDGNIWAEDNVCRALFDGSNTALLSAVNNLSELATYGVVATARTNLGATTAGANLFTLTNPSAVTFLRVNADNTVTARTPAEVRTDLSLAAIAASGSVADLSGLGTGVATFLATPSSANLRAALTDETGTGAAVFATSPALVTPLLGTPTSGTLTNCTGLPLTTGVTGTLPVANGGTGGTTAAAARTGVGFVTLTTTATSGTVTLDCTADNPTFVLSLTNNVTLALSNEADGRRFTLFVRGQASGYTITWFGSIKWPGGAAPTIPTTSGRVLPIAFIRLASGEWLGIPGTECY